MKQKSFGHYISVIYRHLQIYLNQEFTAYGFGSGQYLFFVHISHHEGITQKELSCHLAIDKATTAKAIKKLSRLGYLRSEQDETDRRSYKLYLTDKGTAILPEVRRIMRNTMEVLSRGLEEEQIGTARDHFEIMLANITTFIQDNRSKN